MTASNLDEGIKKNKFGLFLGPLNISETADKEGQRGNKASAARKILV